MVTPYTYTYIPTLIYYTLLYTLYPTSKGYTHIPLLYYTICTLYPILYVLYTLYYTLIYTFTYIVFIALVLCTVYDSLI